MKKLFLIIISTLILTSVSFAQENLPLMKIASSTDNDLSAQGEMLYLDTETKQYYLSKKDFIAKYGRAEFNSMEEKAELDYIKSLNIQPLTYSEVVIVDGASAEDLFIRGRAWFAKSYNSSKAVLRMDQDNILIGKAKYSTSIKIGVSNGVYEYDYDITIQCRDGRYKYTIDNISVTLMGYLTTSPHYIRDNKVRKSYEKYWLGVKEEINLYVESLVESIEDSMIGGVDSDEEDW